MTEAEWLACDDPGVMVYSLPTRLSLRKRRLFVCACVRLIWELIADVACWKAVAVSERYADGLADDTQLQAAFDALPVFRYGGAYDPIIHTAIRELARPRGSVPMLGTRLLAQRGSYWTERRRQAAVLREVVSNPFRPVSLNPGWGTSTVAGLGVSIASESLFDRLPILADALEDAGCDNADILGHLRFPGPHVRGCWALDLLLGKS
jgi:hypothetical protein